MKFLFHISSLLLTLALASACTHHVNISSQATSPCPDLSNIDTLMWHQPDSALKVMLEFAESGKADSLDEFDGHYCQLLISELLYKNNYAQTNRKDLLKAVDYFDNSDNAFLSARAHYMNGVGCYERDSIEQACGEYLKAIEIVETHYPGFETAAKRQDAARHRMIRNLIVIVIVLLVLCICLWRWLAKRKRELQTQMDDALQQSRAMLPQRVKDIYSSKVGNRLERIMDEFDAAYPKALEQLTAAYPDLTPTERRIFVLSHLQFRAKEMADLLGLSENASFSSFLD